MSTRYFLKGRTNSYSCSQTKSCPLFKQSSYIELILQNFNSSISLQLSRRKVRKSLRQTGNYVAIFAIALDFTCFFSVTTKKGTLVFLNWILHILNNKIQLWLLKCCKNKNSCDMKIYFLSIKITLHLMKHIFIISTFFFMISKYIFIQSKQICIQ